MDKSKRIPENTLECVCCQSRSFEISTGLIQCSWCGAAYTVQEMDDLRIQLIRDTAPKSMTKTYDGYQGVNAGYIFTLNFKDKSICLKLLDWHKINEAFQNISHLIDQDILRSKI